MKFALLGQVINPSDPVPLLNYSLETVEKRNSSHCEKTPMDLYASIPPLLFQSLLHPVHCPSPGNAKYMTEGQPFLSLASHRCSDAFLVRSKGI